jgi:glycosyltransferase involved in cell wall biosynthesis
MWFATRIVAMRVSVVLSTYNSPDWLENVLWGYSVQSHRDFEILVADDGSTDETRQRIDRLRRETGLTIEHVWHPDEGFRKCAILNRAIEAATTEYLIFSDGDCIPRQDFLAQHLRFARPGRFLSGGYLRLPLDVSRLITREDIQSGRATDRRWLMKMGVPRHRTMWKLVTGLGVAAVLDTITTTRATWNGHNASGWKADLVRANGFDERMGWGGEDRELGERLANAGIRGKRVRYHAVCVHLEHARGYVREDILKRNLQIREETRQSQAVRTPYGIQREGLAPQPSKQSAA